MNVGQVMTREPRTCGIDETLNQAAQITWERDCGCVPIVDGDGRTVGMVTDRDICMAAYTQGLPLQEIPVTSAASDGLVTVREHDSLHTAERLIREHLLRRFPVVDDAGRAVGILSMNDLARAAQNGQRDADLSAEVIARTLAAVCSPGTRATVPVA